MAPIAGRIAAKNHTQSAGLGVLLLAFAVLALFSCRKQPAKLVIRDVTPDHTLFNEDVYLIFTNTSPNRSTGTPPLILNTDRNLDSGESAGYAPVSSDERGAVDAQVWKSRVLPERETGSSHRSLDVSFAYSQPLESIGSPETFSGAYGLDTVITDIEAKCRSLVSDGTRTLAIYVSNAAWDDVNGTDPVRVSEAMVRALAERFFNTTSDNDDIWDWSTDIFGDPWGSHIYSNLIEEGAENHITILLYDIGGEGSTSGGVVGYFDPWDTYTPYGSSTAEGSDQRLVFALDSTLYASGQGESWDTEDYWPQKVFSTLVHEFQHMIHYYQKEIVNQTPYSSDTWMNEMCSMVAEDLLAQRLGVNGPRGVDSDDPLADTPSEAVSERLSDYNYAPYTSLTDWNDADPYFDYAASYAFGAYIARNYGDPVSGGAELFGNIVRNGRTNYNAVIDGILETTGESVTLESLLVEWGIATFTSGTEASEKTYNRGAQWVPDGGGSQYYNLGSINLEDYSNTVNTSGGGTSIIRGPIPYAAAGSGWNMDSIKASAPASNTTVLVGTGLSGDYQWTVEVPEGVVVKVLTR